MYHTVETPDSLRIEWMVFCVLCKGGVGIPAVEIPNKYLEL